MNGLHGQGRRRCATKHGGGCIRAKTLQVEGRNSQRRFVLGLIRMGFGRFDPRDFQCHDIFNVFILCDETHFIPGSRILMID